MDKELLEISRFDAADYLRSDEDINEYLNEVVSENDPKAFLQAVSTIARARGMSRLSQETGIPRESLYHSLSEKGNPAFSTLWKVADALGYTVTLKKKFSYEKRAGI
ncbi:addiction module antidote protein [Desulfovibrio sp.]|uniref:addiction module antidote protein n=1 Tax=Desulfovibrio sp. TaxID=885 RepID=UPI003AAE2CF2